MPLQPVPASRPKIRVFGKFASAYYPKAHKDYVKSASERLPDPPEGYAPAPLYKVELLFIFEKARTSKLDTPVPDVDNLAKLILDILTDKGYWLDDKYIETCIIHKQFAQDGESPGTYINIYGLQPS